MFGFRYVEFTCKDLKNLGDLVSPNMESIGFTLLSAIVPAPWPQTGPVLVPSPRNGHLSQSESFSRIS